MPEEVQSTEPQESPKETPVKISHKINWFHIVVGVIAGVILLGMGFGVYLLTQLGDKPTSAPIKVFTSSAKQATPSATATPSAEKDETEGWELFKSQDHNQKISWVIKYPSIWKFEVGPLVSFYPQNRSGTYPYIDMSADRSDERSAEATYSGWKSAIKSNLSESSTTVEGKSAKLLRGTSDEKIGSDGKVVPGTLQHIYVLYENNNNVFSFYLIYENVAKDNNLENVFMKMLMTFSQV